MTVKRNYRTDPQAVIATINEKLSPIGVGTICEDEGRVVRLIDIAGFERRASAQDVSLYADHVATRAD